MRKLSLRRPPEGGLDRRVWRALAEVVYFAHAGDRGGVNSLILRMARFSDTELATVSRYLRFILRFRVAEIVRHRPDARDLHELAAQIHTAFQRIIDEPVETLEDTLRTAWGMQPTGDPLDSAQMFVSGVAAAGALLQYPAADLEAIRPHVAKWSAGKGRRAPGTAGDLGMP
jgi:hypothetical protein